MSSGPFSSGDQCNQYRIVRPLGTGGNGCVYEAVREFQIIARGVMQPFLHRVALKCLQVDRARDAKKIERMNLEAILLMDLKHDNIVGFLDWGVTDAGVFYFAMDLLQGKTLADHMSAGRFSVTRSLYVASEIAAGLACAHEKHIMHRDLKPSNVLVTDRWEIKVLDLGAAKHEFFGGISTTPGQAPCTVTYAAPEQLDGSGAVDQRADLFALGVITFQMLTGEHPFSSGARTRSEYAMRQFEGRYQPLPEFGIPRYVAKVVHRALARDPKDRYASAYGMLNDLRASFIRHKEARSTPEDRDVEDIVERRKLRAHLERGDESDPNGLPVARGPAARGSVLPPERVSTMVISEQPDWPSDSVPSARGTRNGRRLASSENDLPTHTASDRPVGRASWHDAEEEQRSDEKTRRVRRRTRMSLVVVGWALSLLVVALSWIIFAGPPRPSDVRAQPATPPPQPAAATSIATPSSVSSPIPAPPIVSDDVSTTPGPAVRAAARKTPVASSSPMAAKKRPSPVPHGIHVPDWDSLADPFSGSEMLVKDATSDRATVRRP